MSKSTEDLKAAFAGESQANRKYTAFAKKADDEGYAQVAKLFRAAAAAEAVHAFNHLKALDGLQATGENLKSAVEGENYEVSSMYPEFIQDAEAKDIHVRCAASAGRWTWRRSTRRCTRRHWRTWKQARKPSLTIMCARSAVTHMKAHTKANARYAVHQVRNSNGSVNLGIHPSEGLLRCALRFAQGLLAVTSEVALIKAPEVKG